MKRKLIWVGLGQGCVAAALALALPSSQAQRPAHPISPTPPRPGGPADSTPRPGGPIGPGHFPSASDGVNRAQTPGVYSVSAVNAHDKVVRLSDGDGRTANVHVNSHTFDVSKLKPGDKVVVDFVMPHGSHSRLEAAHLWPQ